MRPPVSLLVRIALAAFAVFASGAAVLAQTDPPGRVARLNYTEGNVAFAPAGDDEWTDAELNRPLAIGDKLWTDKGVRAEVQAGSSIVRIDGRTQLTVLALDDQAVQLSVTQGTVYLRVRNLPEGENFEVDTPQLAYRAAYPGDYRIDVDPQRGVTRVTIHSGTGAVYGEKGQVLPMGGGQQITFKGRALEKVNVQEQPPQDNFDRWASERNRRDDQSVAARYVPREVVGYQLLDASGEWRQDDNYGPVWYPQGMPGTWAPYRNGRWEWMEPWGWTWIDAAPWAFATSHYGRWTIIGTRWAWVPGRLGVRPLYAPALVAFAGNGNTPLAIAGKPSVAWFPLAPGEAWQPTFRATPLYISSVNANMPPLKQGDYVFQRKAEAMTAVSLEDFNRGRSLKGNALRVPANVVADAQVIGPPAMPERRARTLARAPAPVAAPAPPVQQVTNSGPSLQQQIDAQKQAQAQVQAQREQQERAQRELRDQQAQAEAARREQQRKAAEQQRVAEKLRAAEQERRAEQQRSAEQQRQLAERQQKIAEQQRIAQQQAKAAKAAKAVEAAKLEQAQARAAEQARREAAAKHAEQAKREQVAKREREREAKHERELQAKRAQEAKRVAAAAKKDEQARKVVHAQQVEQARRAADREAADRAQREAWQKQQQAVAEQFKRDQQAYEEQQKIKAQQRQRPDLRRTPPATAPEPEVWQRGIPVLTPGRTS